MIGSEVRILRCYPGGWQVYTYVEGVRVETTKDGASSVTLRTPGTSSSGEWRLLSANEQNRPNYERLVELINAAEGGKKRGWFDRFLRTGTRGRQRQDGRRGRTREPAQTKARTSSRESGSNESVRRHPGLRTIGVFKISKTWFETMHGPKILKLFTMASKTPLFVIFALGTAVFIAAKKSLIPEWIGFGLLVLLSLSIRVFLTKS